MVPHLTAAIGASVWVEFVGLPGAGKSEVSRAVAHQLRARHFPVFEPSYELDHAAPLPTRLASKFRLAMRGWASERQERGFWMRAVMQSRQESPRRLFAVTANWFYLLGSVRRAATIPGIHLCDQGLLQAMWSIAYAAARSDVLSPHLLPRLGRVLPERALIVLLEAGLPTIRARLAGREGGRSQLERDLAAGRAAPSLARARRVLTEIVAIARHLTHTHDTTVLQLRTDGDHSAPANAAAVVEAVSGLLADRVHLGQPCWVGR